MIYTSTKALRYLSIPVYTIFKNLTIILIAYGEVLWFGGSVSSMALFSFGLMVLSSVIAAWADITHALQNHGSSSTQELATLNAGYVWMLVNCLSTAAYILCMRKRIKLTNFKDFDSKFPGVTFFKRLRLIFNSHVLQQPFDYPDSLGRFFHHGRLVLIEPGQELSTKRTKRHHWCHDLHRPVVHFHLLYLRLVCPSHIFHDLLHGWRAEQTPDRRLRPHLLRCPGHDSECFGYFRRLCQRYRLCTRQGSRVIKAQDRNSTNLQYSNERQQPEC